jgi:hypothetical protein
LECTDNVTSSWINDVIKPILYGNTASFYPTQGKDSILKRLFRPFRERAWKHVCRHFRLNLLPIHESSFFKSDQSTTLWALQFGNNKSKSRFIVNAEDDNNNNNVKLALFMDDCRDVATAEFIMQLFECLYQDLHWDDTREHDISPTSIVNYTVFEQVCTLKERFIQGLTLSRSSTFNKYFRKGTITLKKVEDTEEKLFRNKYVVLTPQFSYYTVLIIIKEIGLFPVEESYSWKYDENAVVKNKMQCSSLAFLDHVFESDFQRVISEEKFVDTFSKKLGLFVEERKFPENIEALIADASFVAEVKEWFKDFISPRYYKQYFTQGKFMHTTHEASSSSTERKRKSSSTETNDVPGGKRKQTNEIIRYHIELNSMNPMVCMDCSDLSKKGIHKNYHAVTMTVVRDDQSQNDIRYYYCAQHAFNQLTKIIDGQKHELVWPVSGKDSFLQSLKEYKDVSLLEKQTPDTSPLGTSRGRRNFDYEFINAPIFYKGIKDRLKAENSKWECSKDCITNISLSMECPSNCNKGAACTNKRVRNLRQLTEGDNHKMPGRFECRENNKGKGLYALSVIEKGEDMLEYVGECVNLPKDKLTSYEYVLHLQNSFYLDARKKGNLARFINHSCNPNTECHKIIVSSFCMLLF